MDAARSSGGVLSFPAILQRSTACSAQGASLRSTRGGRARMTRFHWLATATGGLLGLALTVLEAVALRLVGIEGFAPVIVAGLVAGLGLGMLGGESSGVAYGAHIGGFLAGLILVRPFAGGGRRPAIAGSWR